VRCRHSDTATRAMQTQRHSTAIQERCLSLAVSASLSVSRVIERSDADTAKMQTQQHSDTLKMSLMSLYLHLSSRRKTSHVAVSDISDDAVSTPPISHVAVSTSLMTLYLHLPSLMSLCLHL